MKTPLYLWTFLQAKGAQLAQFDKCSSCCKLQKGCYTQQRCLQYCVNKGIVLLFWQLTKFMSVEVIADCKMHHYMYRWKFCCIIFGSWKYDFELLFTFFMFLSAEKFLGTLRKENRKSMAVSVAILALFVLGYLLICSWTCCSMIQIKHLVHI